MLSVIFKITGSVPFLSHAYNCQGLKTFISSKIIFMGHNFLLQIFFLYFGKT